jgi:Carboxypeptidase regulatory-like domain/TonB-dependent Receptor Plug Domain/TonB dependent receptor
MRFIVQVLLLLIALRSLPGQTTQGLIQGSVSDTNRQPVASALVTYIETATGFSRSIVAGTDGRYGLQFLSPGTYRLRVEKAGYQAQEVRDLALPVSARIELDFVLRPLADLPESAHSVPLAGDNNLLPYFGPDLHAGRLATVPSQSAKPEVLQPALSYVIGADQLENLPLSGRNTYSLLITLPGVTTDGISGTANPFSVTGQRPTSSNYLLDGVENNDYLSTGPFAPIPPEAVQEYRVAITNFSAEFGRTAGYIANAVTRSGTNTWHGLGYFYLGNDILNANSFSRNAGLSNIANPEVFPSDARRLSRPTPYRQVYLGGRVGGAILPNRLFVFLNADGFRSRTFKDPVQEYLPSAPILSSCLGSSASSAALGLLARYPNPFSLSNPALLSTCPGSTLAYVISDPVSIDRRFGLARIDYRTRDRSQSLTGRVMISRQWQPDFLYSPYKGFSSPLDLDTDSVALAYTRQFGSGLTNDLRFSWQRYLLASDRPHPEIPTLVVSDKNMLLPGSPALYGFSNSNRNLEWNDTAGLVLGRHALSFGGGVLIRHADSYLSYGRDGYYLFQNNSEPYSDFETFGKGLVYQFQTAVANTPDSSSYSVPNYARDNSNHQYFGFVQDSWKVNRILNLTAGLRYEYYGVPRDNGTANVRVIAGPGNSASEQLAGAKLDFSGLSKMPYRPSRNDWAPRLGFSLDPFGRGQTVLRGSYGLFYDRPVDNLIQDERYNNFSQVNFHSPTFQPFLFDFLQPTAQAVQQLASRYTPQRSSAIYWIDQNLHPPRIQRWFVALQQRLAAALSLEVSYIGSSGADLITNDIVNRNYSNPTNPTELGLLNPNLPQNISFRSNQGAASYQGLTALLRYEYRNFYLQGAYTYSHSIDNQSDPLQGDFLNLTSFRTSGNPVPNSEYGSGSPVAAFTRQFDGTVDRSSSDFDQRHNFSTYSIWRLPNPPGKSRVLHWFLGGWQFAQLLAVRSGFPYTVYAGPKADFSSPYSPYGLFNNRANTLPSTAQKLPTDIPVTGGVRILDIAGFVNPSAAGQIGTTGRNSFPGPGFWSADASVAKTFLIAGRRETQSIQFRADFFNVFNHVNLGNPDSFLSSRTFGRALYGRTSLFTGSLVAAPVQESPRTIQLQVKYSF